MKVKFFIPEYMKDFKCTGCNLKDTCCAGWDINIDKYTYKKYDNSSGELKELLNSKYKDNKNNKDFFNYGSMILTEDNKCPFLNNDMLCDIHGKLGEENLCTTCKSYPRVYNIIDNVYEKSGVPSCIEICKLAFLNKEKMQFIEYEEDIDEESIEIRRIIDTEAFEGTDSIIQYFWDIRVISINIIQCRDFSIEERLGALKNFYNNISHLMGSLDFDGLEVLLDDLSDDSMYYRNLTGDKVKESTTFYRSICNDNFIENIKNKQLKEYTLKFKETMSNISDLNEYLIENHSLLNSLNNHAYIFENYLVNQIFKDLIPFNKGEELIESIDALINTYMFIKAYALVNSINSKTDITEIDLINIIKCFSKDLEHNKTFKSMLSSYMK